MLDAMRSLLLAVALALAPRIAFADPSWSDVPALLDAAVAPQADALRACVKKLPHRLGFFATRAKSGGTEVTMPLYGVGHRGPTPEEKCLVAAIAKIALPALPADIDRVALAYTLVPAGEPLAKFEKRFDDWKDPAVTLAAAIDAEHRAALAACDRKPRTARLTLDLTKGKTRIWLPAWQFHSSTGDGSTPPDEARVKACMTKAIRTWTAPVLPQAMGELQVAFRVAR
jgi:hypothetical protein